MTRASERSAAGLREIARAPRFWLRRGLPLRRLAGIAADYRRLADCGLFDPAWYAARYPGTVAGGRDPLLHFLLHGSDENRDPGPAFDARFYRTQVPRLRGNALLHYLDHGRAEGRPTLPAQPLRPLPTPPTLPADWPRIAAGSAVSVAVHGAGNLFMADIARLIASGLAAAGLVPRLLDETTVLDDGAPLRIIVAPHEFFLLPGPGGRTLPLRLARQSLLVNVEQPQTDWFRQGLPALMRARGILDISQEVAERLRDNGLPAAFLPLGHVPGHADLAPCPRLPSVPALATLEASIRESQPPLDAPLAQRPLDLLFVGYLSPRRMGILARMAERLARWRCHFLLTEGDSPQVAGVNAQLDAHATVGLAQRAKLVLNLHQAERAYFEWHRIVLQGIWQRSLVVSEPGPVSAPWQAGEHFLAAPLDELPDLIDWLLGSPAGQALAERVRLRGWRQLTEATRLGDHLRRLLVEDPA
jgi:hypothetical protein